MGDAQGVCARDYDVTLVSWDPMTTNCDGTFADDVALYEVRASFERSMLESVAVVPVGTHQAEIPMTPAPGQVLYILVDAWDYAGNSSRDGCVR